MKEKLRDRKKSYRAMTEKSLLLEIEKKEKALSLLTVKKELGKIKNHREGIELRREIARLNTIIREKIAESLQK